MPEDFDMEEAHRLSEHALAVRGIPTKYLVGELIERGVLRRYGIDQYVPSIVRRRQMETADMNEEAFARVVMATTVNKLTHHMLAENLIAFGSRTPPGDDAPPGDVIYTAEVLTLDPKVKFDD